MISDEEYLERIVAGIHALTTEGADVSWNENINGRQFDVVVRFEAGTLRYLVLIEVKNKSRKAAASDLEAFATKARDNNANKAVFVTAAGFQRGAIRVAVRHGIDVFTVTFAPTPTLSHGLKVILLLPNGCKSYELEQTVVVDEPELVAEIHNVILVYENGTNSPMPEEQSQLNYYCKKTRLEDGRSLGELFLSFSRDSIDLGYSKKHELELKPPLLAIPPDRYSFPSGKIAAIQFTVEIKLGHAIKSDVAIDPGVFSYPIIYTDAISKTSHNFAIHQLPLGVRQVTIGKFYFHLYPLSYYYCRSIENGQANMYLIESFQHGELITAIATVPIVESRCLIPVTDKVIGRRLEKRLRDFQKTRNLID